MAKRNTGNQNKAEEKKKLEQKTLLNWILSHWDCVSLEEALELAKRDVELHRKLREAGIRF